MSPNQEWVLTLYLVERFRGRGAVDPTGWADSPCGVDRTNRPENGDDPGHEAGITEISGYSVLANREGGGA